MNYVTLTATKQALSIDASDTSKDAYLQAIIKRVSGYIDEYTNRTFSTSAQSVTDELHQENRQVLWLGAPDIGNVTAVKAKFYRSDSWTTLDTDLYEWKTYGRICLDQPYPFVQVSYTHGGTGVPAAVEGAALQLVSDTYNAVTGSDKITSEKTGDYSVTYASTQSIAQTASSMAMEMLDKFRVVPV